MLDKQSEAEIAENIRQRNQLKKELAARVAYHKRKLGLGESVQAEQQATTLALLDMKEGNKTNLDYTATAKPQSERFDTLEKSFTEDMAGTLRAIDRALLKPKEKRGE